MKHLTCRYSNTMLACFAVAALALPSMAGGPERPQSNGGSRGMAVAYPWVFDNGTSTSRTTAVSSADEIGQAADYASIPDDVAKAAWGADGLPTTRFGHMPSRASLETFGSALHAKVVIYGSVSWHTRSIWVNLGPKTISTATVNAYVFDVKTGKVIFRVKGMQGRSDEKSNGYKIAADIVLGTPLVTAVSGGPATPQEQRAVRIALDKAYQNWAPMTK